MEPTPLLEAMSQQVARDCEAIRDAARLDAERFEAEAKAAAEKRREDALAGLDGELGRAADQSRRRAEAEAHMVVLTAKDTVVDEIMGEIARDLAQIASREDFPAVLDALLAEVLADAPKDAHVLVPAAHEDHCRRWLEEHGHAGATVVPSKDLVDGIAVQDEARTFRVTNTLSTRMAKQTDALRKRCLEILFPGGAGGTPQGEA